MSFVSPAVTIFADDLGIEARGGLRTSAVSAPTRLQVMTGKYNFRNWRAFGVMDPAERTFAHELRDAGYRDRHRRQVADLPLRSTLDARLAWQGAAPEQSGVNEFFLWHARHTKDRGSRFADPTIYDSGTLRWSYRTFV